MLLNEKGNIHAVARNVIEFPDSSFDIADATNHRIGSIDYSNKLSTLGIRDKIVILDAGHNELGKTEDIDILN